MAGPSPYGSVPNGSGCGWQHLFVTLMDASRGLCNSKNVRWAFLLCNPLDVLLVTSCPSCPWPFFHMPFSPTLLFGVLMVPRYPRTNRSCLTAQRTSGCSDPILSNRLPCCFSVPFYCQTCSGVLAPYCLAAARLCFMKLCALPATRLTPGSCSLMLLTHFLLVIFFVFY